MEPFRVSHGPVVSVLSKGTVFIEAFGDLYLQKVEEIFLSPYVCVWTWGCMLFDQEEERQEGELTFLLCQPDLTVFLLF